MPRFRYNLIRTLINLQPSILFVAESIQTSEILADLEHAD